jgi:hypothetical protein
MLVLQIGSVENFRSVSCKCFLLVVLSQNASPGRIIEFEAAFADHVSAEMAKGYTDTLLSFQIFFDFQDKFFIFRNFLCPCIPKFIGQGNCCIYFKGCLDLHIGEHYIRSVEIYNFARYGRNVPI